MQRRIGIYANAEGRPAGDVGNDVQKIASAVELPTGYRLQAAGQQQDMQESFQAAVAALGLAVIFIYLILASQFASFTQPVAIMASLLDAGQVRLRPILMTTAAMLGGMLPLALALGEGGENQAPMGRAIIGGVITSTLLTLVVVPVIYTYLDEWNERRKSKRGARSIAALPTAKLAADD